MLLDSGGGIHETWQRGQKIVDILINTLYDRDSTLLNVHTNKTRHVLDVVAQAVYTCDVVTREPLS